MSWVQLGMDIDGENPSDQSGSAISINGDGTIVAIGGPSHDSPNGANSGHVRVYSYNGTNWDQLGLDIIGDFPNDQHGNSVSINSNGTRVAIGALRNDSNGTNSGYVRIYEYNGVDWVQLGNNIVGENSGDQSGLSVSISSNGARVAIGSNRNNNYTGHARIYEFDGTNWIQLGLDIDGENLYDQSGTSVSLNSDGTRIGIGATTNDGTGTNSGHVRIYEYNGIDWVQLGSDIDGENATDFSGRSISINSDGTRVAIGALQNDGNGNNSGHVRVYNYNGIDWIQLGIDIDGENAGDFSGSHVSINGDGDRVAIGATSNNDNGASSGHVRIYEFDGTNWVQLGMDIDGENTGDGSGRVSISLDGTRVAIGAPSNNGNGTNSGHVRIFEFPTSEEPGAGGDPHIKPIIGRQYDLPHNETSYLLLDIPKQNLSIVGECWKLPESQYKYQLSKINNHTKKNAIKTLLKEATYFKYIKIQLNNETVIYDMDTLEQVKYEPSKFKTYTLEQDSASFDQIKESKIVRSKEGLFGSSINYTSIKCIEKIVSLKLSNDTVIKVRLAKDRKNILYRNSISLVDIGDIKIITLHGALVRKEIIEVAFNKDLKRTKTT